MLLRRKIVPNGGPLLDVLDSAFRLATVVVTTSSEEKMP